MLFRKIVTCLVCTLVITSALFVVNTLNNNLTASGDPIPENNGMGLNYTYMWNITEKLANIVHKYQQGLIPKGRAFGSWGCEDRAKTIIYKEMNDNLSLNPKLEKLRPLTAPFDKRYYAQLMDVEGYRLTIEHPDYTDETNLPSDVPLAELFPIVTGYKDHPFGEFTHNYTMLESDDVRVISDSYFENEEWPFGGSLTGAYKNVTCSSLNGFTRVIGNVTLIDDSSELPSEQTGYVFILDEEAGCENILNNISNTASVILLHSDSTKYNVSNASKYSFSLERLNESDENLTNITERLENGEIIFSDNFVNNSQVTFTYDLASAIWPSYNFMYIVQLNPANETLIWKNKYYDIADWLSIYSCAIWILNARFILYDPYVECKGFILYSNKLDESHYMMLSCTPWSDDRISEIPGPYLPIFSVNKTVGEFLVNQGVNSDNTISGYIDQVYYEGTTPSNGIDAYDIVGHINIPKSPEDKIVVISNRQDSWWGECPGDSGAGAGIVLGIAKYFKEHDITPKYNLTFLQTTGEELQMRGAYFYSDNHSEDNIFLFIGTDQLGMEQPGSYLNLNYKSDSTRRIVYAITNETHYVQRTKYQINNTPAFADNAPDNAPGSNWGDSTDDHVWKRRDMYDNSNPCDTIVVNKENWTSHHQTGLNFNEGDSLKNTNRSDLNITFELFWNITKYFCVNPDCEFENLVFTEFDSPADGDTLLDSIRADFSINSVLPNDKVMVNATLCDQNNNGAVVAWKVTNYTITTLSQSHPYNITITIPDTDAQGEYSLQLRLYNSTGRINKIIDSDDDEPNEIQNSDSFHLYHPFGNPTPGNLYHSTEDIIRGSYFTANEYGTARNITAYVQANTSGTSVHSVCMIYRKNDSKLIGRTVEILPATGRTPQWRIYNFTTPYPVLEEGTEYVLVCWSDGLCNLYYDHIPLTTRGRYDSHTYGVPPDPAVFIPDTSLYSIYCGYRNDTNPPWVTNITENPHTVGFGGNVTISADVVDNESGVNTVTVNIGYPGGRAENKMMTLKSGDTYQYVFNNTWLVGQYNYTIWATDNANNTSNHYDRHHFHVSADASISIATLQDSYSGNQYINITDPPNIPENYTVVNRGLTWDEYYNAITGQNILEVSTGPVNYQEDNGTWTPINNTISQLAANHPAYVYGYRNGNNHGLYGAYFKSNAQNEWPVAFTYNRSDDPTTYVIRSKLVGVGYVDPQSNWAYQYLQNIQSSQGQFTGNTITYEDVFTGTDVTWSYGNTGLKEEITLSNTTKTLLQNHPPSQYGFNDASSYLVFITKLDHQSLNLYNSSGLLDGNVTISDNGVEFRDMLGQFKCALPLGEAYESNNESVRQRLTYRIVRYHDETYLLSGLRVTDLNSMTFPVVIDPTITINVSSSSDERGNYNSNYQTAWSATTSNLITDPYIVIGQRKASNIYMIHRGFVFIDTSSLPANAVIDDSVLSLYKYSDSSTTDFSITIQNGQPTYPHDPLQTSDYNKALYSGDGGKLNTASLVNGYNNISLNSTGLGWINRTGWTKLCLRSSRDISGIAPTGNEYVTFYSSTQGSATIPKLIITYRNQSKIKNTGSTDIKGYLLIQVQFYETGKGVAPRWVVDNDTVNETSPRIINSGSQLGLDTVFNGKIRTSNLQHGTGTYRVYTAFRDPEGTILRTNDGTELKAWWQFSKT